MPRQKDWEKLAMQMKAKKLHDEGYRSDDPMKICKDLDIPYERAVKICKHIQEYEES